MVLLPPRPPRRSLVLDSSSATRVPSGVLRRRLERARDRLWLQGKTLERARIDALTAARRNNGQNSRYDPAPQLLLWHLKRVTADIEFLDEFRQELEILISDRKAEVLP